MRQIDFAKSDYRIKKACKDAFDELDIDLWVEKDSSTLTKLTVRQKLQYNRIIRTAKTIIGRN